ncbi:MAG TPA: hypothetical protein VFD38_07520 [Myxococcaceae bacterium]|nr:hypothetical protein [Myxococcaceae bacterium]
MLRRFTVSLGLAAVLVAACGGGADTSNPAGFCNAYASAFCNKAQACGAPGATSSCASQLQNTLDCPHFACPAGGTFDSEAAGQCIDALNGLSCTDAANGFPNGSPAAVCARICR